MRHGGGGHADGVWNRHTQRGDSESARVTHTSQSVSHLKIARFVMSGGPELGDVEAN